ncbi:L-threonylcarbamoyladenylate synthase [Lentilactobacillus sp. SPB1-3]|uniref:L-threonylcarbamoyladenylate synthase n=1 Tax=Lentilactobacillus terminaliae TaxID=3003483 RepID=A0ACD5DDE6_9LACO|nr:L-threonylcarbamoyladenylate synthase [Lentilactobacillus sp. SPB1-3]MCZ0977426.1 L-threonylcarbamoyladenylate synthase [Lentilactobacillus sp. SPB1-3]
METKILKPDQIDEAAKLIRAGELVAFPTETVYGLGADATNESAVKQVYQAKGRPSDNPLIVHVADIATVEHFADTLSAEAHKLMDAFWPGSLTMIFKLKPNVLSPAVTGGLSTAAFRFPNNQTTLNLIKTSGKPMVGPSANTSGKPSPTTAQHVYHDLKGKIAAILDDGPTEVGVESTVLDMSTDQPAILRPGAVTKDQIEAVIGKPVMDELHHVGVDEVPKAPGMKYKHYAPNAQVYIVDPDDSWKDVNQWVKDNQSSDPIGVMAFDKDLKSVDWANNIEKISLGTDVQDASHNLFNELRAFDDQPEYKTIFVQGVAPVGLGEAYMNRLNKSAGQMHFKQL